MCLYCAQKEKSQSTEQEEQKEQKQQEQTPPPGLDSTQLLDWYLEHFHA